jgi:hypothetical protein
MNTKMDVSYRGLIKYALTRKKQVLTNIFDAELTGRKVHLALKSDKVILFHYDDYDITILYIAILTPKSRKTILPMIQGDTDVYYPVSMETASNIVKLTWEKRSLPPKIELIFFFVFASIAAIGILEMLVAFSLFIVRVL